jgi:DNA-binding transcriptional ArsR family regulator
MKPSTQRAIDAVLTVDRLVHEPARLAILTVLASAEWVEFSFLETVCRLSKGNLSSHLAKLEAGGLVEVKKSFQAKKPLTRSAITAAGRTALERYRSQLSTLVKAVPK